MLRHLPALVLGLTAMTAPSLAEESLVRTDRRLALPTGETLFIREVRLAEPAGPASALLLLHGARVPGLASFDLPVEGGSLAAELALAGHSVYLLDLRGYGGSSRPAAMEEPPEAAAPLMRTDEALADIAAAVEAIEGWSGDAEISLVGWATGGHWAGAYASRHPDRVERLVVYNTLYGGSDEHALLGRGSAMEDPRQPGTFHAAAFGAYRLNTADSLFPAWDTSIPAEDKAAWRDPLVAAAYAEAALASDPTAESREPPSFRAPSGALADSFELALDRRQWSASALAMPVLVIRSGRDFWSRPEDAETLAAEAPDAELLVLPDATHFVHLDRDEAGRAAFLEALIRFLAPAG